MSQIVLTSEERSRALERLGYTPREAAFLCLAALHGGYFLRRQYCRFLGKEVGGTAAALIEKLHAKQHVTTLSGYHNAKVHHLSARPFYASLGQEDNRNRRNRAADAIKSRLMGLDFVLENPKDQYLATEQEKVTFFTTSMGVAPTELPTKTFRSPNADETTNRFFVDKYPIFLAQKDATQQTVSFCFIDEGTVTAARFVSHLAQYATLFSRLPSFSVIYVAARPEAFEPARKVFDGFLNGRQERYGTRLGAPDIQALREYFELRKLYDDAQLESFDRDTLIRFRNQRAMFQGAHYEALYSRWATLGAAAFQEVAAKTPPDIDPSRARFSNYLLDYTYDIFGN